MKQEKKENKKVKSTNNKFPFMVEVVSGVSIFLLIITIVVLLNQIVPLASRIKETRSELVSKTSKEALETGRVRLVNNKTRIESLESMFIDDANLIDFIKLIDEMKSSGTITSFDFFCR
jgi:hypothetical protein